jgi:hypothetical protein
MLGLLLNELERTYKEAAVAILEVLFWHLPRQTEKKHVTLVRTPNIHVQTQDLPT